MFTPLDRISGHDRSLAGGKAYNRARLRQAGFPVPDGLVIPTDSAEAEIRRLADAAWLTGVPLDTRFAVRSSGIGEDSAGHSFAGIHETHLNVERGALVDAVLVRQHEARRDSRRAGD